MCEGPGAGISERRVAGGGLEMRAGELAGQGKSADFVIPVGGGP